MPSLACEQAIADAMDTGNAILKIVSANDVGKTGGHQRGYYLPISAWKMFSPHPPERGKNHKHPVTIIWQDGRETQSCVSWYGKETRREYRLTRFGRSFPALMPDKVGALLVLVIRSLTEFAGYLLESEEDIEELSAVLGVEIIGTWGVYQGGAPAVEGENTCIEKLFASFADSVADFPPGATFSTLAREALDACVRGFRTFSPDDMLIRCYRSEYRLFQIVEERLCGKATRGPFASVDAFLRLAKAIMNRRKSRAGRSLENHVDFLLQKAGIPHQMRPAIPGRPDIVIPGKAQYDDLSYPVERLLVIGVKTTCKDRWRQVLREAPRVPNKHILTTQPSISVAQLREMRGAGVTLIVPKKLQNEYPKASGIDIINLKTFIENAAKRLV